MEKPRQLPTTLKVVAILFILGGIFSFIDILVSLLHGHLTFNFNILGLFIGPALLDLRPGWRTCALVFLWTGLLGIPPLTIFILVQSGSLELFIFNQKMGDVPKVVCVAVAAFLFLLYLWQYQVLTRPDVRQLFGLAPR